MPKVGAKKRGNPANLKRGGVKGVRIGGRQKGTPNKVTTEFRDTVQKLLDDNRKNVAKWLAQVAEGHGDTKPDPARALDLMGKLAEFAAPKLSRTEVTGAGGKDLIPPQFIVAPVATKE
jgi:hypothetical protein